MSALQYVRELYTLDTLDTRFTTSSKTPPSQLSQRGKDDVSEGRLQRPPAQASQARWSTTEFRIYGVIFALVVPTMFYTVYSVSQPWNPNYSKFEPLLSPGWIPARKVDNSDAQYSSFRDNLPYLFIVVLLHPFLRRVTNALFPVSGNGQNSPQEKDALEKRSSSGTARRARRLEFDFAFGLLFLFALHGLSAPKILFILWVNYSLATRLERAYVPAATWIFNIGILFANELAHGYRYQAILDVFLSKSTIAESGSIGSYLDSWGGLMPRWEVLFKITILRMISFNFDRMWAMDRSESSSPLEKKQLDASDLSERDRVDLPARLSDYSFRNYLAYALYSPLYIAGPILTFNDYFAQQQFRPKSISFDRTLRYALRFLLALLAMELVIHYIYVVAISKADPAWDAYSPYELSMLGYFNLHHIWLKLLLPWRLFRLWALIDEIDPPENMVRCMSDNYSAFAFWRGWHRSYNRWIIRYIYIPLGGSGSGSARGVSGQLRGVANTFVVFSFVAIWHDIQLRLLIWGWLVTLFVLPEVIAGFLFPKSKWKARPEAWRALCGVGAVGNILMMMCANLVGFAVGLDGLKDLIQGIVGSFSGVVFFFIACGALYVGVQVMFEIREDELRQGINMKC